MDLVESFKIALFSLVANKMRSALTMLGIIIGVSAVILLVSIGNGVQADISAQIMDLGSNVSMVMPGKVEMEPSSGAMSSINKLELKHSDKINDEARYVEAAVPMVTGIANMRYNKLSRIVDLNGVSEDFPEVRNYQIDEGKFFSKNDLARAKKVCILGSTVAEDFFDTKSPLRKRITLNNEKFTVIGVTASKGSGGMGVDYDDQIFMPVTTAQNLFETDSLSIILIQSNAQDNVEAANEEVERVLLKELEEDEFTVVAQEELLSTVQTMMNTFTLMLGGIASISLLVGGIGIMNIMLVSVTERTREIGIRKAVGARTYDILSQFVIEAITLSIVGGIVGITVGTLGSLLIRNVLPSIITVWSVALAFLFSFGIGVFFGVYPAYKAAGLDPIEALRHD